jgi:hypothetical protein
MALLHRRGMITTIACNVNMKTQTDQNLPSGLLQLKSLLLILNTRYLGGYWNFSAILST